MKSPKSSGKPKKPKLLIIRRVVGKSMLPGLHPNRLVLGFSLYRRVQPDHVVIIHHDGTDKIKRIQKITNNRVFVVGDNERASLDSRNFGWLPKSCVIAKVVWPRL